MEEKNTAYHEAGHAVIAIRFDHLGEKISIIPEINESGSGITLGFVNTEDSYSLSEDREKIIFLYAGFYAELKHDPHASQSCSASDFDSAEHLLQFQPTGSDVELRDIAYKMVNDNWPQIEAVSSILMEEKTLNFEDAEIIVDAIDEGIDWKSTLNDFRAIFNREGDAV